jgi:hypothetical protein
MCKLQSVHLERREGPIGIRWRVRKRLINRHEKALGVGEGGRTVLNLYVTGFWDMTSQTVAQIYRRFGGTC